MRRVKAFASIVVIITILTFAYLVAWMRGRKDEMYF
jgi:hypothetical protein